MLDFVILVLLKIKDILMEPKITDWIVAYATVIYVIITGVLAWIAWQANKTWKEQFNLQIMGELKHILQKIRQEIAPSTLPNTGYRFVNAQEPHLPVELKHKVLKELESIYYSKNFIIYTIKNSTVKEITEQLIRWLKALILIDNVLLQNIRFKFNNPNEKETQEDIEKIKELNTNRAECITQILGFLSEFEKFLDKNLKIF